MNIRNNATDMRNYIKDLYSWEDEIANKKKQKKSNTVKVPIRGNV